MAISDTTLQDAAKQKLGALAALLSQGAVDPSTAANPSLVNTPGSDTQATRAQARPENLDPTVAGQNWDHTPLVPQQKPQATTTATPTPIPTGSPSGTSSSPLPQVPRELAAAVGSSDASVTPTANPAAAPLAESDQLNLADARSAGAGGAGKKRSLMDRLRVPLEIMGAVGSGFEAAGNRGNSPSAGRMNETLNQLATNKLAREKLQQVEIPEAQARADYYSGRNQTAQNVAQTRADAQRQVATTRANATMLGDQAKALAGGLVAVKDAQGQTTGYRAATKDEVAQAPLLQAHYAHMQAQADLAEMQGALADAHRDAIMNPNNPTFQQKERQIQAQLAMAQRHLDLTAAGVARENAQFQINNGVKVNGTPADIVGAGQELDAQGKPIGKNFQTINGPTTTSRNMGQTAATVLPHIQDLRQQIAAHPDVLGPFAGRWSQMTAGKWGSTGDPAQDQIVNEMLGKYKLMQSAVARTHFGGKSGPQAVALFNDMFNAAKTPQGMLGVLDAVEPYMQGYKEMGTTQTTANTPRATTPQTPQTHTFDAAVWSKANKSGDVNAAIKYAQSKGYKVTNAPTK